MAEFCKKHSQEMGFPFDGYPVFCESCVVYYPKPKSIWKRLDDQLSRTPKIRSTRYWSGNG